MLYYISFDEKSMKRDSTTYLVSSIIGAYKQDPTPDNNLTWITTKISSLFIFFYINTTSGVSLCFNSDTLLIILYSFNSYK